jgi:Uma2 family endonuclease
MINLTSDITQDWPEQGEWTYEDWLNLPSDGYLYEVIEGVLHMSPPPSIEHQRASLRLVRKMADYADAKQLGEVLEAPVGVRLPGHSTPVLPDALYIHADQLHIIGKQYVEGVPDLIVEILSPGNWFYDRRDKLELYQEAGVAEYWIVDPRTRTVEIYQLDEQEYLLTDKYGSGKTAVSQALTGFTIAVDDIFPP